jgi:glucose-1-phosphate adenylyltransferase
MRMGPFWYKGTADAVYQNIHLIFSEKPDVVCVFGGDHIYMMDIRQMLDFHLQRAAEVTVAGVPVPLSGAHEFGIIDFDSDSRIIGFQEKPKIPRPIPDRPDRAMASMGNYIFNTDTILSELEMDALRDSSHDFGKTILPEIYKKKKVFLYDFSHNEVAGMTENQRGYWRDVGNIDTYWQANMDLVSVSPVLNLYLEEWPIRTTHYPLPAAKFVFADKERKRLGIATDSLVSEGCIISGGHINRTILAPRVKINSYSYVTDSILHNRVNVGRYAQIRKAIVDKGVDIPTGAKIGYDLAEDRSRFVVSEGGVVVIPKGYKF